MLQELPTSFSLIDVFYMNFNQICDIFLSMLPEYTLERHKETICRISSLSTRIVEIIKFRI